MRKIIIELCPELDFFKIQAPIIDVIRKNFKKEFDEDKVRIKIVEDFEEIVEE